MEPSPLVNTPSKPVTSLTTPHLQSRQTPRTDSSTLSSGSDWSIDLRQAFPKGTNSDSYFIGGPPQNLPTPPCFCGKMLDNIKEAEEGEENDEWDAYWDCTVICKMRRRYQTCIQEKERRRSEEESGVKSVEYVLFVEGGR